MAAHVMSAAAAPDSLQDAQERIAGIQKAATILMQRLYAKDPRRWVQVAMMSPPELVPWPEQPDNTLLGLRIKSFLRDNPREATLRTNPHGVVEVTRPLDSGIAP